MPENPNIPVSQGPAFADGSARDLPPGAASVSARTQLLRAAADMELDPSQAAELARHLSAHPEDQAVIDFERRLRGTIATTWGSGSAPASLRERVLALRWSAGEAGPGAANVLRVGPGRQAFPAGVRWLALAASVAIVAGVSFFVLRDQWGTSGPGPVQISQQYRTSLVSFIGTQHDECELHADLIGTRFKTTRLSEVPAAFAEVLGSSPSIGRVDAPGFRLMGAGPCAVPGRGKSVRMILECRDERGVSGAGPSIVSIHIQQDTGELALESGRTYLLTDQSGASGPAPEIFVWRRDGFVYFLTSRSAPAMQMARSAFGVAEPSGSV